MVLVLAAALLHAAWNGLVKHSGAPLFTLAGVHVVAAAPAIVLAFGVPAPHPDSWPLLAASVAVHTVYYALLAQAYRFGDLSYVYPLARGTAPVMIACGGYLFAGEALAPLGIAGVGLASIGIASIGFSRPTARDAPLSDTGAALVRHRYARPALGFALATSCAITAYTLTDGIGVRKAGSALGYIAWLIILEAVPLGLYVSICQTHAFGSFLRARWKMCLGGGCASGAAYGAVIYAMNSSQMAMVSALRETSVIFAALIGTFALRESFGQQRIRAALLVTLGVILMQL